jgi:hypothetical protein
MGYIKELIHLCARRFFRPRRFFVPREHCWGSHIYMGKNMGSQFAMVMKFEITVSGVPKLQ